MEKVSIVLMVSIVSIVCLSSLYTAYADEYTSLGIRHADNPLICLFEPDPLYSDKGKEIIQAAYNSVDLWKTGLIEQMPNGNWDMDMVLIPLEDHKYKNASQFPICNILISFEYTNETSGSLGYTFIDFSKSYHKYTHVVVFLNDFQITEHYEFNLGTLEQEKINTTFKIVPFSMIAVQNIITHEFGHAIGIGHYKITDYPIYTADKPWINASVMYYALNPQDEDIGKPLYVDIKMAEKMYGEDGFGGARTPPIKTGYYSAGDDDICIHKCGIDRFDNSINRFIFGKQ